MDLTKYIAKLSKVFEENNVCGSHGIEHALAVTGHAEKAIEHLCEPLSAEIVSAIKIAALLHDADDRKFFPLHTDYENLRAILDDQSTEFIELVLSMIRLVSASANGDNIPEEVKDKLWMLIPRYADRLEAVGIIGIQRCYKFTISQNSQLFLESSPRFLEREEILTESLERYKSYSGHSVSMIDHFYDKLIAISFFPISNPYFDMECEKRRQPLIDFLIYFSTHLDIDKSMLQ